jgi:O-antigen ligase
VLALWAVRLWVDERPKILWPPANWAVLAFTIYAVWRYATCDIEYVGRLELLRMLIYAALFLAIVNNLHGQNETRLISYTLIFLAMAIAMCAVWQFLSRSAKVPALNALIESLLFGKGNWFFNRVYAERSSGTYINPNHLAGLLEMLLPLAFAYLVAGRTRHVTRILLGYAALVMLAGIAVSGSRGSWAATGGALTLLFLALATHRSYRLPAIGLLILLLGAGTYFIVQKNPFKARLASTFVNGEVELDMRGAIWESAVRMTGDHPWHGVGPGHFNYRWREYRPATVQLQPDRAHNDYLNVLVDWGIVGGILVASVLGLLAYGARKTWTYVRRSEREFKSNRSDKFAYVAGATFSLVALALHSVVDFNLHIPANAIVAVTLGALLCSHVRFATEQYWTGAGVPLKLALTLPLLAGMVVLGQQSFRLGSEFVWLERASVQAKFSDEKIALLEKAHAVEPRNAATAFELGECLRTQSFEGGPNYEALAGKAMEWYARGTNANRFEEKNYIGLGRSLDYLGRFADAQPYFDRADELDPNGYYTSAMVGLHYREMGDFVSCRIWSERSLRLSGKDNPATANLLIANERLQESAARILPPKQN